VKRRRAAGTGLLLALAGCADTPPARAAASVPDYDWCAFSSELAAHRDLPAAPLLRARAVANATAAELDRLGVLPNFDASGRERARTAFGDAEMGTCGHLARSLAAALRGAGVDDRRVHVLAGMRVRPALGGEARPYLGPDWFNADHAAVLVAAPVPMVLDLWLHGRQRGAFAGFDASPFCGMPAADWLARMRADDYVEFHLDDELASPDIDGRLAQIAAGFAP